MDSIKSFKGYGKVDEAEERAFREKTRRRLIILVISIIVLLAVVIGAVAGTIIHKRNTGKKTPSASFPPASELTPAASLKTVCSVTQYPDSCFSSISSLETQNTTDPALLFSLSLRVALNELSKLASYPGELIGRVNDSRADSALKDCATLLNDAVDRLNDSMSSLTSASINSSKINDLRTWLSTALTDQDTCLDSLEALNYTFIDEVRTRMQNSTEFTSNSLAIVTKVISLLTNLHIPIHRRLMSIDVSGSRTGAGLIEPELGFPEPNEKSRGANLGIATKRKSMGFGGHGVRTESGSRKPGFPAWVDPVGRRLLQSVDGVVPNVTVAMDGSGNFTTIKDAVNAIPKKSPSRFVIYVKAGTYLENVILDKNKWNVMIYGDGKTKSIVSGSLNFVDGTPTYSTATFAVQGKGFIAKDMGFINTAGAAKHQAVAFRSGSDQSVMYLCSFDGFQDTLYAHSNRQFYRDCDITGTIDFIFGNAAVVFQNCNILPRQPQSNQFNTITAQGKKDPNENTGISIQKCSIAANGNVTAPTYLGRPWKAYSTTVIMQSTIGQFLNPKGWMEWTSGVDPPATIYYGEYENSGPGSGTTQRVAWAGYKPALSSDEASRFTVGTFIQGADWLSQASVTFQETL